MTLGEQAYNESLRMVDPQFMNASLPQWPHHLTQGQLRHWHTAVGRGIRSTKHHFRFMRKLPRPTQDGYFFVYYLDSRGMWSPLKVTYSHFIRFDTHMWVSCDFYTGQPMLFRD